METNLTDKDHYLGCLLGGAIGDALGAPVEFMSRHEINCRHGSQGVTAFVEHADGFGEFTDDTQMLLFTAEGLVSYMKNGQRPSGDYITPVNEAYRRWLHTQSGRRELIQFSDEPGNWLAGRKELHKRRAPGLTCLSSLEQGRVGSIHAPLNDSKGCGTIMRIAPVGLVFHQSVSQAFQAGVELSALTHGHPSGYLSGGFMAALVASLVQGNSLRGGIGHALEVLVAWDDHKEVEQAVQAALRIHHQMKGWELEVADIQQLGGAWVAEEALAISLLCALHHQDDFSKGVLAAVNHGGDSDSTGAITGNILGLMLGPKAIPAPWKDKLRYRDIVEKIAGELVQGVERPSYLKRP